MPADLHLDPTALVAAATRCGAVADDLIAAWQWTGAGIPEAGRSPEQERLLGAVAAAARELCEIGAAAAAAVEAVVEADARVALDLNRILSGSASDPLRPAIALGPRRTPEPGAYPEIGSTTGAGRAELEETP